MYRIIAYIFIGFGLIFGYIKYIELRGIFYPIKKIEFTPRDINLSFEDVYIKTADNLLINGWFIPNNKARYTLLFFHGNAGNIGHRLDKISLLQGIGLNIFIVDYRGYGRSAGRPSEWGFYLDAEAAYNYLLNTRMTSSDQIILYGESIGTGVVIKLASESKVKAIILEGAFSCGRDIAKRIYPFLPSFLFSNKFNSLEKIKKVKAVKLFLHSKDDDIIPLALSKKLFGRSLEPKFFVELNGDHNTAFLDSKDEYLSAIAYFIDRLQ